MLSDWEEAGSGQPSGARADGRLLTGAGGPMGALWVLSRLGCGRLHGELEPGQNSCLPKIQEYAKALFSSQPLLPRVLVGLIAGIRI